MPHRAHTTRAPRSRAQGLYAAFQCGLCLQPRPFAEFASELDVREFLVSSMCAGCQELAFGNGGATGSRA